MTSTAGRVKKPVDEVDMYPSVTLQSYPISVPEDIDIPSLSDRSLAFHLHFTDLLCHRRESDTQAQFLEYKETAQKLYSTDTSADCSNANVPRSLGSFHRRNMAEESCDESLDFGDNVDLTLFDQILEMEDEEDDKAFTKGLVYGFLEQAEQTFDKMDAAVKCKDLPELSSLGHFLKGSSATLGFIKIRDQCERIQHFGAKKDENGLDDIEDEDYCLVMAEDGLTEAKKALKEVTGLMKRYFGDS